MHSAKALFSISALLAGTLVILTALSCGGNRGTAPDANTTSIMSYPGKLREPQNYEIEGMKAIYQGDHVKD